jgi:SAM-dependent methyltransferase
MEALRDRDSVPCRALDLACGSGRNALALAEVGYEVDAVDISVEGIERGRRAARARNLKINWLLADLDRGLPVTETYDLIVMIRYLDLALLEAAIGSLNSGGRVVAEVHLDTGESRGRLSGPRNPAFLVTPGALVSVCAGLEVIYQEEGRVATPEGRTAALARIIARRSDRREED